MKKEFIKRYGWTLLGIVAGMVGGYLYWRYVGCTTGTCPITSSPVNSSIWGAAMVGRMIKEGARSAESLSGDVGHVELQRIGTDL